MEKKLTIGIVIGGNIVVWTLIEMWWYWYRPWSQGERAKDEMQRQYGGSRTWVYLFIVTIVLLTIWFLMTSGWSPG